MQNQRYERFKIRKYLHWTLYLHENQHYLGRCYAWLNRDCREDERPHRLSELSEEERYELFHFILSPYEKALDQLFGPDHINYAWFGNEIDQHNGHGHMHLIPRYEEPITFAGHEFCDEQWGENYAPYPKNKLPKKLVSLILEELLRKLN